jgi:hypothetical protein
MIGACALIVGAVLAEVLTVCLVLVSWDARSDIGQPTDVSQ